MSGRAGLHSLCSRGSPRSTVSTISTSASRWRASSSDAIPSCVDEPSIRCCSAAVCAWTDSVSVCTDSKPLSAASCGRASRIHRTTSSCSARRLPSISITSVLARASVPASRSESAETWRWSVVLCVSASAPSFATADECAPESSKSWARHSLTSASSFATDSFTCE